MRDAQPTDVLCLVEEHLNRIVDAVEEAAAEAAKEAIKKISAENQ